tara:strand:- start:20 stop:610 length:591 start_codon:yes stop_codon:yes gene_type:complete
MIVSIQGQIIDKKPDSVIININGLGYLCYISANTYSNLPSKNKEVFLETFYNVTEHSQELYAFSDILEKELFLLLIGVSGIGPKTAITLLSAVTPAEFKRRLIASEVGMLTALPGIGPKTARRIIVELKDKFVKLDSEDLPIENNQVSDSNKDAIIALETLGYKATSINKVLNDLDPKDRDLDTQELIKKVLNKLR